MVYYMKKIQITGKRNKEQLLSSSLSSEPALRSSVQYQEPSHEHQVVLVNKYFMGHTDEMEKEVKREITRKIGGYKAQDIKKNIYDANLLVSVVVLEKLVVQLRCHYCRNIVKVLFLQFETHNSGHLTAQTMIYVTVTKIRLCVSQM